MKLTPVNFDFTGAAGPWHEPDEEIPDNYRTTLVLFLDKQGKIYPYTDAYDHSTNSWIEASSWDIKVIKWADIKRTW